MLLSIIYYAFMLLFLPVTHRLYEKSLRILTSHVVALVALISLQSHLIRRWSWSLAMRSRSLARRSWSFARRSQSFARGDHDRLLGNRDRLLGNRDRLLTSMFTPISSFYQKRSLVIIIKLLLWPSSAFHYISCSLSLISPISFESQLGSLALRIFPLSLSSLSHP